VSLKKVLTDPRQFGILGVGDPMIGTVVSHLVVIYYGDGGVDLDSLAEHLHARLCIEMEAVMNQERDDDGYY